MESTEQELREKSILELESMFFMKHGKRLGIPWMYANDVDLLANDCIDVFFSIIKEAGWKNGTEAQLLKDHKHEQARVERIIAVCTKLESENPLKLPVELWQALKET